MPRRRKPPALEVYKSLQERLVIDPPEPPPSPLEGAGAGSLASLLYDAGFRQYHEVAALLGFSVPQAERLCKVRLAGSTISATDEAALRQLIEIARQRMAAYAAMGHALSRVFSRAETKAITERLRDRRWKL